MVWSAENATRAYLYTLKSGNKGMEPDMAEYVSALAAGRGSRLMVEACSGPAGPTTLALVAAAKQTGGRVVCVLPNSNMLESSTESLGDEACNVELIVGDAGALLINKYKGLDFVLVVCELHERERVFVAVRATVEGCGGVVVGYNALGCLRSSWGGGNWRVDLLPIGGGLCVCRVPASTRPRKWVVTVDPCTGEEHVYRVMTPSSKRDETSCSSKIFPANSKDRFPDSSPLLI